MAVSDVVLVAIISAVPSMFATWLAYVRTRKRSREIRTLVDGQHTIALAKIDTLQKALAAIIKETKHDSTEETKTVV